MSQGGPTDTDETRVVDHSRLPPMQLERPGRLQRDCERLEGQLREGELPRLQAIYDRDSYAKLSLDQLLFMRELELRAKGG